jgi:vitamin B12 transporter
MRQRQKYADLTSEPTHVTVSAGSIVEFDLADVSPGTRVSGAFDYSEVDSHDSLNPDLGVHSRSSASVVANHVVERGVLHFAVEGAGSYTSDFDAAMTGAVAAAVVSDPWRAWVSWGRSYRAPTMNELYWPEDTWSGGNPELEPESVTTLEAGVEGGIGVLRATVTAYRSRANELIVWVMSETDWKSRPMNVGEADLRGVELELGADLGDIGLRYAGSFGTAEDADTGLALPYRPDASQWFAVTAGIGRVTTELRLRLTGESYVNGIEGEELNDYNLVDFSTLLELPWEGTALRFEGLNITDQRYFTRQYYDMPGSEWRLSLLLGWEDDA